MARIFITGSTDGLGRAAARSLLDDGHEVVLGGRRQLQLVRLHALTRCDSIFRRSRITWREAITMAAIIYPITPSFAAEIGDVDLSCPIGASELAAINEAFAHYVVLIFPDQHLSQDQHLDFARHFGPLETTIALHRKDEPLRLRPEFADVSNLNHESKVWREESRQRLFQLGNRLWHTDSSFKRLPARASLLYARSIPPLGGHTEFADERAAYDALPEETKRRLDSLVAEHSIFNSRARLGFTNFSDEERQGMPPPRLRVPPSPGLPKAGRPSSASLLVPPGATKEQVGLGDRIFHGEAAGGTCTGRHGSDARGGPQAPSLVKGYWLIGNDSLKSLEETIVDGVPNPRNYEVPMPPKGGAPLSDSDVAAVAAYLGYQPSQRIKWLSH